MKGGRRWARRIRRRFSAPASGLRYSRVWSIHPPPGMRGDRTDRLRESKATPSVFRLYTFTSDLLLQTSDFRLQTSDFRLSVSLPATSAPPNACKRRGARGRAEPPVP